MYIILFRYLIWAAATWKRRYDAHEVAQILPSRLLAASLAYAFLTNCRWATKSFIKFV